MTNRENDILEVKNVSKVFDVDTENEKEVLRDVNLKVGRNEFLCLLGPSGCGKTTLLRCIAGFEDYEGSVAVNGVVRREPEQTGLWFFRILISFFPGKRWRKIFSIR